MATSTPAEPLAIDLMTAVVAPTPCPYGPGTTKDPQGHELTADSRSFFLDAKPWVPVVGEFHYARYPRDEWRDALLKMKAGGINSVSTYVFWIHHEEEQGNFDWTGQRSLRDFLKLCQEVGLKAFVRMGPWSHGEARNGGFPDWVQHSGTKLRTTDPAFLKLVGPFFDEQSKQMQGLLWKDGGPVVGIQVDNECDRADYLLALKDMARAAGVDVPFYAITGWQGGLPKGELIPLFGGYSDGFWGGHREDYRREYLFTDVRAVNDLGAQLTTKNPANARLIGQFPYACVEIGGGMMSSYGKRIKIEPANVASLALSKLGSGNNMPGYYMYQGGTNPEGKHSYLHEDHPNQMPVKDYDFQTALGAAGQVREQYHLLRQQHLFLQDFGSTLARMPAYFPGQRPKGLKDFDTLRWAVRSDGNRGFLFFNNQQPYEPLPEHKDVQFAVKTAAGTILIPRRPTTIPVGSYGIWPINLDCDGVTLEYATAQPLCRIQDGENAWYFFAALKDIPAEFSLMAGDSQVTTNGGTKESSDGRMTIRDIPPGLNRAASVKKPGGGTVNFVVLSPEAAEQVYRVNFAGKDRIALSKSVVFQDGADLRLQATAANDLSVAVFPPVSASPSGGTKTVDANEPIFTPLPVPAAVNKEPLSFTLTPENPAGPRARSLKGTDEVTWNDATTYKVVVPAAAADRRVVIRFHYTGDAARLYAGDQFLDDHFYNGDSFDFALWRVAPADQSKLRLKVLPYSDGLLGRLPKSAQEQVAQAKSAATIDEVRVSAEEQFEARVSPTVREGRD